MKRLGLGALGVAALVIGCSSGARGTAPAGRTEDPITHGTNDTTHQSVMFLYNQGASAACSGTVIAVKGTYGFLLTAAHCMASATKTNLVVIQGDNEATSTTQYPGVDFVVHPNYQAQTSGSPPVYDFAIVKFNGAGGATPTTPMLTKTLDDLAAGSPVTIVGYGETSTSGTGTGVRRYVNNTLADNPGGYAVSALTLGYIQNTTLGGACSGDSGGPLLYTKSGTQYVAGVTSYGDQSCTQFGISGRVSAIADWAQSYVDGTVINPTQTCAECEQATTTGVGTCSSAVTACQSDTDCSALLQCLNACASGDTTCSQNCFTAHTTGATVYGKIGDCVCNTGCKAECASDPLCQAPACGFSFSDQTCGTCVDGACCAAEKDCAGDSACAACATSSTPDPSCSSNTKMVALQICYAKNCSTACGFTNPKCGFTAQNTTCQTCFENSCCSQAQACADDVACTICIGSSSPASTCGQNPLYSNFMSCLSSSCSADCGGSSNDGGIGGSGGSGGSLGTGGGAGATASGGGSGFGGASGASGTSGNNGTGGALWDGGYSSGGSNGNRATSGSSGSCSVSHSHRGAGAAWMLLGLLGLAGARRRRAD